MAKPWKCPFCESTRHKTLDQKVIGVWYVRLECTPCGQVFTVTKQGTRAEGGPDPLKLLIAAGNGDLKP